MSRTRPFTSQTTGFATHMQARRGAAVRTQTRCALLFAASLGAISPKMSSSTVIAAVATHA